MSPAFFVLLDFVIIKRQVLVKPLLLKHYTLRNAGGEGKGIRHKFNAYLNIFANQEDNLQRAAVSLFPPLRARFSQLP